MKKRVELIRINTDNYIFNKTVPLYLDEAKKNVMVLGTTGSGKTTSVLLPMINNLIKNDCCGLIMDVKSELFEDIICIADQQNKKDKIYFIGTEFFCNNFNLIGSLKTIEELKSMISSCKNYNIGENGYWFENGLNDVIDMVIIDGIYHRYILKEEYKYRFDRIFDLINNNSIIIELYKNIEKMKNILSYASNVDKNIKSEYIMQGEILFEEIKNCEELIDQAYNDLDILIKTEKKILGDCFSIISVAIDPKDEDKQKQKTWRAGAISNIIKEFLIEPFATKLFSNDSKDTLHNIIYEQQKIIVLVIPSKYEALGFTIGKLLRQLYFKTVMSNNPQDRDYYQIGESFNRYTFLLIDEYQGFVNTDASNGVITDASWTSISRSYENINIFATQSIRHLDKEIKDISTDVILTNCANEIILKTQDPRTIQHLRLVYNRYKENNFEEIINPTNRICYARIENNGSKTPIRGNMNIQYQNIFHGDTYKKDKIKSLNNLFFELEQKRIINNTMSFANKVFLGIEKSNLNLNIKKEFKISEVDILKIKNSELFLRCKKNEYFEIFFDNLKDEEKILFLDKNYIKKIIYEIKNNRNRIKNKIENNYFIDLKNTIFVCNKEYHTYKDIKSILEKNNIFEKIQLIDKYDLDKKIFNQNIKNICFIVGGGDKLSTQFDFYREIQNFNNIIELNPEIKVFTALGHANNIFMFDMLADKSFITATELGFFIVNGYENI